MKNIIILTFLILTNFNAQSMNNKVLYIYQDADKSNHNESYLVIQQGIEAAFGELNSRIDGYEIKADEKEIAEVLEIIIKNALISQTINTKPEITIKLTECQDFGHFCITDNGIGIPEKFIDKVFKGFQRAVSNKAYSGIGMGIATAKKIIQEHGGNIEIGEKYDLGTAVKFIIAKRLSND